jgi:hypothetical protein
MPIGPTSGNTAAASTPMSAPVKAFLGPLDCVSRHGLTTANEWNRHHALAQPLFDDAILA